jgi:hypothetical protein
MRFAVHRWMDSETRQAIDVLRADLRAAEARLRRHIDVAADNLREALSRQIESTGPPRYTAECSDGTQPPDAK